MQSDPEKIWTLPGDDFEAHWNEAYINDYDNLIQANSRLAASLNITQNPKIAYELVELVKDRRNHQIREVLSAIETASIGWRQAPVDKQGSLQGLQFALQLWLFTNPALDVPDRTLAEANHQLLADIPCRAKGDVGADIRWLSTDFSATTLTRKAGFYLVFTSNLWEHLTFASPDQLRVFRHAHILRRYQSAEEKEMYPDGFFEETYRMINLIFPFEDLKTSKRVRRLARRRRIDIEASVGLANAINEHSRMEIASYRYFSARLALIQRRYDLAKPRRLSQWWYDQRQRIEWGALMVALIVFALTIISGTIQSVTGIIQVRLALKDLKR